MLHGLVAAPTAAGLASRLAVAHLERRGINPGPLLMQAGLSATALAAEIAFPWRARLSSSGSCRVRLQTIGSASL